MKNDYCDLSESEIHSLPAPDAVKGILLSPFQHNRFGGFVHVPEETFKEMVDLITKQSSARAMQAKTVLEVSGFLGRMCECGDPDADGKSCIEISEPFAWCDGCKAYVLNEKIFAAFGDVFRDADCLPNAKDDRAAASAAPRQSPC